MSKVILSLALVCAVFSAFSPYVRTITPESQAFVEGRPDGRTLFFSDSLNARGLYRIYPVPNTTYTPAPKGYKPVYISSYARHGSRRMLNKKDSEAVIETLEKAEEMNCLTPLGREVLAKVKVIDDDMRRTVGELTQIGAEQHRDIVERMYNNYTNVFCHKNTPVRFYSTSIQRTMMSMFSAETRLLELNPKIRPYCFASRGLTQLVHVPELPKDADNNRVTTKTFLNEYYDARPLLSRLFTDGMEELKDTASFVSRLSQCAVITCDLDLEDVDFLWDVFTYDELYVIQQAYNYRWYVNNSNSAELGYFLLPSMSPLLRDFIDKADAALAEDVPGADMRFGHDSYLTSFCALIGLNGFVPQEEDPLKVIDIFQGFAVAPMAGNVQMVFYRNRAGDVIVKLLQNEVEAFVPIESDIYPYYHWNELKAYFESRIDPEYLVQGIPQW